MEVGVALVLVVMPKEEVSGFGWQFLRELTAAEARIMVSTSEAFNG